MNTLQKIEALTDRLYDKYHDDHENKRMLRNLDRNWTWLHDGRQELCKAYKK